MDIDTVLILVVIAILVTPAIKKIWSKRRKKLTEKDFEWPR